jgi:hypothetical protein
MGRSGIVVSVAYVVECGVGVVVIAKACTACCVGWEGMAAGGFASVAVQFGPFNGFIYLGTWVNHFFQIFGADNRNRERKRRSGREKY